MQASPGLTSQQQSEVKKMIEYAIIGFKASISNELSLLNQLLQAPLPEKKSLDQSPLWLRAAALDPPKDLPSSQKTPVGKENVGSPLGQLQPAVEQKNEAKGSSVSGKAKGKVVAKEQKRFAHPTPVTKKGSVMSEIKANIRRNEERSEFDTPVTLPVKRTVFSSHSTQQMKQKKVLSKQ
eukprot:TRINITY_DN861_c0_g4_i1.p1 TRINITY_DN861_c0_g4~~TRINITY_DN861_c0_g4_i1.p1  ORF type:complete len:180 (+),score=51.47 TRINITY_DN861_c0_g4_i1:186-725(+)